MRRRDLSEEELTTVINLKRAGSSWVNIQRKTEINRRTAKRAYEKWDRSQSIDELKKARTEVAAAKFSTHMESLITLAGSLVTNLRVPVSLADMEKNTEQFFSWLWQQDLLQRYISSETQVNVYTMGDRQSFHIGDPQSYRRENEMLFESLKVHTREEVRWNTLDEWGRARDDCIRVLSKLRKAVHEVVGNHLNLEQKSDLVGRIKEKSVDDNPIERMIEAVLKAIWQGVREDKLDQELVRMVARSSETQGILKVRDETLLILNDRSLMEEVLRICNLAVTNLCKGEKSHIVKSLQDEIRVMENATEALHKTLNPLRLTSVILRTRCDLCPA